MSLLEICTSTAKLDLRNFSNKWKLTSQVVAVPEIQAIWWIEVHTADSSGIPRANSPPVLSLIIELHDPDYSSFLGFSVEANVKEERMFGDVYFLNHHQEITGDRVVMTSTISLTKQFNSTSQQYTTKSDLFSYDCSVVFRYTANSNNLSSESIGMLPSRLDRCYGIGRQMLTTDDKSADSASSWPSSSSKRFDSSSIASLFEDDTFADFAFDVRGKIFKVHRFLLAQASEVFKKKFSCGFGDTPNSSSCYVDCDPELFHHLLKFIYTGSWPVADMPLICCDLYELAHQYEIVDLMEICLTFILAKNVEENALELYEFASNYGIQQLIDTTWIFIRIHMLKVMTPISPKPIKRVRLILAKKILLAKQQLDFNTEMESLIHSSFSDEEPVYHS